MKEMLRKDLEIYRRNLQTLVEYYHGEIMSIPSTYVQLVNTAARDGVKEGLAIIEKLLDDYFKEAS